MVAINSTITNWTNVGPSFCLARKAENIDSNDKLTITISIADALHRPSKSMIITKIGVEFINPVTPQSQVAPQGGILYGFQSGGDFTPLFFPKIMDNVTTTKTAAGEPCSFWSAGLFHRHLLGNVYQIHGPSVDSSGVSTVDCFIWVEAVFL